MHRSRILVVLVCSVLAAGCQASMGATLTPASDASGAPADGSAASTTTPDLAEQGSTAMVTGLTIPWAVGGRRMEHDGSIGEFAGEWPPFGVGAVRLWDTYTTWANLEPSAGRFHWGRLDGFVAQARAQGAPDVTLVLAGTPGWAASRIADADASWIGPGSASPPRDIAEWQEFVTAVAARYRGRITAYEIGNEPNLPMFWNGSPAEYEEVVRVAAAAIRVADPSALVVVDGGLVRRTADVAALSDWLSGARGNPDVDSISVHLYPRPRAIAGVPALLASVRQRVSDDGMGDLPLWVTELNVSDGARLRAADQAKAVTDLTRVLGDAGVERAYWYAWTDLGPTHLIQLHDGRPAAAALARVTAAG